MHAYVVAVLPADEVRSHLSRLQLGASGGCMRVVLMSLLMIPLVVGCGGDGDKSGDDTGSESDADTDANADANADGDCSGVETLSFIEDGVTRPTTTNYNTSCAYLLRCVFGVEGFGYQQCGEVMMLRLCLCFHLWRLCCSMR